MAFNSPLIIILLNAICILSTSASDNAGIDDYEKVHAASACFNSVHNNESTIFTAPKNGTLAGIVLSLLSGYAHVACPANSVEFDWGCMHMDLKDLDFKLIFHTILSKLTDPSNYITLPYYPSRHTRNILHFSAAHHPQCSQSCFIGNYTMYNTSEVLTNDYLALIGPFFPITTADRFMLQYLSACCSDISSFETEDMTVCARVDFLYNKSTDWVPNPSPDTDTDTDTDTDDFIPTNSYDDDSEYEWSVVLPFTFDLSDLNLTSVELYMYKVASTTTVFLREIAYNTTDSNCIIDDDHNVSHVTETSFAYTFEVVVCNENTAISLAEIYTNAFEDALALKINHDAHLIVSASDIKLDRDELIAHALSFSYTSTYDPFAVSSTVAVSNVTNDEWSLQEILIANGIGCIAIVALCVLFYKKNQGIRDAVNRYKVRNEELQDRLLAARANGDHQKNSDMDISCIKDTSFETPGLDQARESYELNEIQMPDLPSEYSAAKVDTATEDDSDTSEEMYVEMGTTNRGGMSVSRSKTRGVEGRVSLQRLNTDSDSIYGGGASSFTRDGDPTGGDGILLEMGETSHERMESDSHQAFMLPNDHVTEEDCKDD